MANPSPAWAATSNAVAVFPTTTPSITEANLIATQSPELDYDFDTLPAGDVEVAVYALPTHRIHAGRGLRYAVAIDHATPRIVDFEQSAGDSNRAWGVNVLRNAAITSTVHTLSTGGKHTLKIFMVDPGVVLEKLAISVGPAAAFYLGPPDAPHEP